MVAKPANSRYHPGQRRGWLKYRVRCTTEAIIGGVTGTLTRPETLLVGRYDLAGRLRYTGRSFPLSLILQQQIVPHLQPAVDTVWAGASHPWPQPLPAAWSGQLPRPQPLPYLQVVPAVVVEISVDTAFENLRWRHGVRVLRTRTDLTARDVPMLDTG